MCVPDPENGSRERQSYSWKYSDSIIESSCITQNSWFENRYQEVKGHFGGGSLVNTMNNQPNYTVNDSLIGSCQFSSFSRQSVGGRANNIGTPFIAVAERFRCSIHLEEKHSKS